jgi:LytS/YehU family sensor histidine kinase
MAFYLNYLVYIPKLLFKRKFVLYGISFVGTVAGSLVLSFIITRLLSPAEFVSGSPFAGRQAPYPVMSPAVFTPIWVVLLFIIGIAAKMTGRWLDQDKQNREIKQEQLQTELAFLKNQVSPHFFFNTLNNIYALAETDSEKAREVTYMLSKLMRYLLYESEKDREVTLGREITFIKTYVELMRVRLTDNVTISFDHGSEQDNCVLPPLLFITFVENAFKHGISLQENCSIKIALNRVGENVEFSVINIIPTLVERKEKSGGLGLVNIQRRLELLYGKGNYNLDISESENAYDVQLKLPVNDD